MSRISGPSVLRQPLGSTLTLECSVTRLPGPPANLYWTQQQNHPLSSTSASASTSGGGPPKSPAPRVISPKTRAGVSIESERLSGMSFSKLVVVNVTAADAGVYSCVTDVTQPADVTLIVGE